VAKRVPEKPADRRMGGLYARLGPGKNLLPVHVKIQAILSECMQFCYYRIISLNYYTNHCTYIKAVPLQAWTGPEGSRKLRFPDFVTTAQDGGRLSALSTGRLYS